MKKDTTTVGVRMPKGTSDTLRGIAAAQKRTPSDLLAEYAEEVARRHRFCHIEFRSTPLGRMAYVESTRSAVWLICDLVRQNHGDIRKTAEIHQWPESKVRAAVNYAQAFPDEIEPLIQRAHEMTEQSVRALNAA